MTQLAQLVTWTGTPPAECDLASITGGKHDVSSTFIDGATTMGPWANMCSSCHRIYGRGLGTGRGQKYVKTAPDRWVKSQG